MRHRTFNEKYLPNLCLVNDPINRYFLINCILLKNTGSCEHGTFLCDDDEDDGDGNFKCLPHHLVCGRMDACREKYKVVCGLFYGHVDYIKNITSISDVKLTSVVLNTSDSPSCGKWKHLLRSIFRLLCRNKLANRVNVYIIQIFHHTSHECNELFLII